jgi:DNA invertase Pin-like site-specific DNA recombinase
MENKYFLYVRKSTDDLSRQVRSIDDQIAELTDLARREQFQVVEILTERQTAKRPGRPVFNAMLDRIEQEEASGILAWHPDRLSRNSLDSGRIIYMVDTGVLNDLRFCTQTFEPTAQGKFNLGIMFNQSKYYVDNLSENIRRGQRQKLRSGIWPMVAPVGYLNDRATRTIYLDPQRAPLVRKAFELYATGDCTIDQVTDAMDRLGLINRHGDPLSRAQVHRLLRNPIYMGVIEYKGERFPGKHEPIVTPALFQAVQEVIGRKSKPKSGKLKPYLYRGMIRCGECGRLVTAETQKGHVYLRCTKWKVACSQPYVREESVAEQVASSLKRLSLPPEVADWLIAEFQAEEKQERESGKEQAEQVRVRVKEVDEKLDRLMSLYLEKGVSLDEYRTVKNRLVTERQVLTSSLTAFEHKRSIPFEPAISFIRAAKQAGFVAAGENRTAQCDFLKKAASNFTLANRDLNFQPRKAWQLVAGQRFSDAHETAAPVPGAASPSEIDHLAIKRRGGDHNSFIGRHLRFGP